MLPSLQHKSELRCPGRTRTPGPGWNKCPTLVRATRGSTRGRTGRFGLTRSPVGVRFPEVVVESLYGPGEGAGGGGRASEDAVTEGVRCVEEDRGDDGTRRP